MNTKLYRAYLMKEQLHLAIRKKGVLALTMLDGWLEIRVLHRMAFGIAKPEHLIALALLDRGGYCPPLPGRHAA